MSLKIWINAFIPQTVVGYTKVLAKGPLKGKTAVPLPGLARLNPLNLFKNWDAGYLTDQRTFDSSPSASVRMQSMVEITLSPDVKVKSTSHTSSGTTEVDMDTGTQLDFGVANMSRCQFSALKVRPHTTILRTSPGRFPAVRYPTSGPPTYELELVGQASDPLVSTAADIDYVGVISFGVGGPPDYKGTWVEFAGKIDAFPAFECYASLNGQIKTLFTAPPPAGNTVTNLPFGANRSISKMVSFP